MKKIFFMLALFATAFTQNSYTQDSTKTNPAELLNAYYKLKDALINSNPALAASNAEELVKSINGVDKELVKENTRNTLLKDAGAISQSKDLKLQRERFATLSANMFELAKMVKLSAKPIY